jgi:N-acyl-D-aspartate/D-glutamate deacylase
MPIRTIVPLLLALTGGASAAESVEADVVVRGALLCDGTGKAPYAGDIAIKGERIVAVGEIAVTGSPRVIDGAGLIVAPGFIDLHTHSDRSLTQVPTNQNLGYLHQGLTTAVTGNCGSGPVDVAAYFKELERVKIGSNVIHQIPHGSVRERVMGNANRAPTPDEMKKLEAIFEQGMKDGAFGMSTGLIYNPGTYSQTDELIALARVVAKYRGHYASHIRNEALEVVAATEEAIRIGKEAGLPVHISHMKASGKKAWGKVGDTIGLIEKARSEGQAVTADQYPYTASSTSLMATIVPPRFREGTSKDFLARLDDREIGPRLREAIAEALEERDDGDAIQIGSYPPRRDWQGKRISQIAREQGKSPLDVSIEILRRGGAHIVNFSMNEEDVRLIMKQPFVATASDGSSQKLTDDTVPHPRSYGCYPRKVGHYALKEKVISLEHAVRSASGLPADILRLKDRGYLRAGYFADVVVFDPKTFLDQATFDKPHQLSTGVRFLLVNGQFAIADGKATGTLAGKVLRHEP